MEIYLCGIGPDEIQTMIRLPQRPTLSVSILAYPLWLKPDAATSLGSQAFASSAGPCPRCSPRCNLLAP